MCLGINWESEGPVFADGVTECLVGIPLRDHSLVDSG